MIQQALLKQVEEEKQVFEKNGAVWSAEASSFSKVSQINVMNRIFVGTPPVK